MRPQAEPDEPFDCCEDYVGLVVRAADNTLEGNSLARLEAHAADCPRCRRALDGQTGMRAAVAGAYRVAESPAFVARVMARIEPLPHWLDRLDFRAWTWRVVPIAAVLFVAAGITVSTDRGSASQTIELRAETDVEAGASLPVSEMLREQDLFATMLESSEDAASQEATQ
jgi:hypothetical protein